MLSKIETRDTPEEWLSGRILNFASSNEIYSSSLSNDDFKVDELKYHYYPLRPGLFISSLRELCIDDSTLLSFLSIHVEDKRTKKPILNNYRFDFYASGVYLGKFSQFHTANLKGFPEFEISYSGNDTPESVKIIITIGINLKNHETAQTNENTIHGCRNISW